ncbi:uncharacterized protein [Paramormyrops kingsleyae]|uniref:uncharacterized protein n=1 Tax=Paramormyrops kingsleyae TaxID=1676925 RepID=UPI003B9720A1
MAEQTGSRPLVFPDASSRTLQHPSFVSLYMAVGSMQCGWRARSRSFPAPAMIPSDFFYNDPLQAPGHRIPNNVAQLEVFECCQLNTPAPIMSASITPPIRADPFRTEPRLIRDLGSQVWAWDHLCAPQTSTLGPTLRPRREVIQLSAEEDQAITNLLKLRHDSISEPNHETPCQLRWSPAMPANQEDDASIDCIPQMTMTSKGQSGQWSDTELEAADILLTLDDGEVGIKETHSLAQGDSESRSADTVDQCLFISSGLGHTSLGSLHVNSDDVNSAYSVEDSEIGQVDRAACGGEEESENSGITDPQDDCTVHCGGSQWLEESSKWLQKQQEEEQLGLRTGLRDETEGAVVSALLHLSQQPQGLPPT